MDAFTDVVCELCSDKLSVNRCKTNDPFSPPLGLEGRTSETHKGLGSKVEARI